MWCLASYDPKDTLELGCLLGLYAPGGTVFTLNGDLGAGKTLLAKGIAVGLEVGEPVTSPTFTIVNQYLSGRLVFNHMDIYRIHDEEELWELGIEEYFQEDTVSVIEWPDILGDLIPQDPIKIIISKEYDEDGNQWRTITIVAEDQKNKLWLEEALYNYAHTIH